MSLIVDIADAVVTTINSGTYELSFFAKRMFLPKYMPSDLKDLLVTVVPVSNAISIYDRAKNNNEIQINVGIQQVVDDDDAAVITLLDLTDEIIAYMDRRKLIGLDTVRWIGVEHNVIYGSDELDTEQVFISLLTFTYRTIR